MSIEKKSLISNRRAVKKANLTKATTNPRVNKVASPKMYSLTRVKLASIYR